MKNPSANNPLKGKPVVGTFMTYIHNSSKRGGQLVEVDFNVKGKDIQYIYTTLKKGGH